MRPSTLFAAAVFLLSSTSTGASHLSPQHESQSIARDSLALLERNGSVVEFGKRVLRQHRDGKKKKRKRSCKSKGAKNLVASKTTTTSATPTSSTTVLTKLRSSTTSKKSSKAASTASVNRDNVQVSLNHNGSLTVSDPSSSSSFTLTASYSGSSFFDNFDFFTSPDPTNGQVNFLSETDAWNKNLVAITSSGTATMRADDTTWLGEGENRNSVRITSKSTFGIGSLIVLDAVKMPYGDGVWPAFWTVGANWPAGGEIDIVEQINNSPNNQYTLHTDPGCTMSQPMTGTGQMLVQNCDATIDGNLGCGILDNSGVSFGSAFNNNGGGVFATLWTTEGISIWFFPRDKIPANLISGSPNTDDWGTPAAIWGASTCDMEKFFSAQTLVFDITICGGWAGNQAVWSQAGFSGTCSDAVKDPTNFTGALFEVNYIKVYTQKS